MAPLLALCLGWGNLVTQPSANADPPPGSTATANAGAGNGNGNGNGLGNGTPETSQQTGPQVPTEAQIRGDIQLLGSPSQSKRQAGTQRLYAAGLAAEPFLRAAAVEDEDPEVRSRALRILSEFRIKLFKDTHWRERHAIQLLRRPLPAALRRQGSGLQLAQNTEGLSQLMKDHARGAELLIGENSPDRFLEVLGEIDDTQHRLAISSIALMTKAGIMAFTDARAMQRLMNTITANSRRRQDPKQKPKPNAKDAPPNGQPDNAPPLPVNQPLDIATLTPTNAARLVLRRDVVSAISDAQRLRELTRAIRWMVGPEHDGLLSRIILDSRTLFAREIEKKELFVLMDAFVDDGPRDKLAASLIYDTKMGPAIVKNGHLWDFLDQVRDEDRTLDQLFRRWSALMIESLEVDEIDRLMKRSPDPGARTRRCDQLINTNPRHIPTRKFDHGHCPAHVCCA
ncbi:MAG: hypothetical protein AAFP69_18145, partial [Planctomycetota bacterium]